MSAAKKIKKYVGPAGWIKALSWICLAAAVASLLMCTVFKQDDSNKQPALFDSYNSGTSDYVYLDLVGVSDWALKRTSDSYKVTYYFGLDADGYIYALVFANDDLDKMAAQRVYWDEYMVDGNDGAVCPDPMRVYGSGRKITADIKTDLADYFELTDEEFDQYIGTRLMSIGNEPSRLANEIWTAATVVLALAWFGFTMAGASISSNMKKCIKALKKAGKLEQAAEELGAADAVNLAGDVGRLTENFFFGRKTGTVIPYSDILWAFVSVLNSNFSSNVSLVLSTADRKRISGANLGMIGAPEGDKAVGIIAGHNPDVIIGYSKENEREYKVRRAKALGAK